MWLCGEQINKISSKARVESRVLNYPCIFIEIKVSSNVLGWQCPPVPAPFSPSPANAISLHLSQTCCALNKG